VQLAGFLSNLLQGRGQTADEIARAALFFCCEQSSAITGQSINVDGGARIFLVRRPGLQRRLSSFSSSLKN
jgi:enoyl-[acyl-carrier-protein] reductase (NADH)